MFVNGKRDGKGELTYDDGSYYCGCFKNGVIEGEGMYFHGPC